MKSVALGSIDSVYRCAEHHTTACHLVHHSAFHQFCIALRTFERQLGDLAPDDFWAPWLRVLTRYRFEVSAVAAPFDHPALIDVEKQDALQRHVARCKALYPGYESGAQAILDILDALVKSKENPLLEPVKELLSAMSSIRAALLIKEPRLLPVLDGMLDLVDIDTRPRLLTASDLRDSQCYDVLIVIGPARWFPNHVFTAARATSINLVRYAWIEDALPTARTFAYSSVKQGESRHDLVDIRHIGVVTRQDLTMDPGDIIPRTDWLSIVRRGDAHEGAPGPSAERVQARLVALADEKAVYLEDDDHASVLVIDLYEEGDARVMKRPMRAVEPGMFVLLRTVGGGDYIVPVANTMLGEQAGAAREAQKVWKALLRSRVRRKGLPVVLDELRQRGAVHASDLNLRNWMSEKTIRPDDDQDFAAILAVVDQSEQFDHYRKLMQAIIRAHIRAGQHIRRLLLDQVALADLQSLEHTGTMTFSLDEGAAGSLTAFRVDDIAPEPFMVALSLIGHPFAIGGV